MTAANLRRPEALALARELALLGAEAAMAEKDTSAVEASEGFTHAPDRFRALGERMRAHAAERDEMSARLFERLGLSEEGYWLVQLAAAAELLPEVAAALSIIAEDERVHLLTPVSFAKLLRAALGIPFGRALSEAIAGSGAERLGLVERVEIAVQKPLTHIPLRLVAGEARYHFLGDVPAAETTALSLLREPPSAVSAFAPELVRGARSILDEHRVLCIRSPAARIGRQLAIDIASVAEETALIVVSGDDPPDAGEVARLRAGLPVIDLFAACHARSFPDAWLRSTAARSPRLVVLVPHNANTIDWPTADVNDLDLGARARIFAAEVGEGAVADNLAERFRVSVDEVRSAVRAAHTRKKLDGNDAGELDAESIADELLAQGARRMGRLVTHIRSTARLQELVIPPNVRETISDILGHFRARNRVLAVMGVAGGSPLGRGLSCLFSGSPGTGKTFAAQCLATELGLNLYRIDLSQVVSKYIGETEKALSRVFEEAEAGHGILLFDEADALFGKRSEVKDAHDRYANVEVAYLLQRMESFEGISILTTNMRTNIDTAFLRRLRFVIEFPMPDAVSRRSLWERSVPRRERWQAGLDLQPFVDRFPLTGGNIHNIGVAAAHLAAAEPEGILRVEHLVRATYRELEKVGLARSQDDFGPLAAYLPNGAAKAVAARFSPARGRA